MRRKNPVKITKSALGFDVDSPYNPGFISAAKAMRARWDAGLKVWRFPPNTLERDVEDLCREVYGYSNQNDDPVLYDVVVKYKGFVDFRSLWDFGRSVAFRAKYDKIPIVDKWSEVMSGGFTKKSTGGSSPIIGEVDAEILIVDVPAPLAPKRGDLCGPNGIGKVVNLSMFPQDKAELETMAGFTRPGTAPDSPKAETQKEEKVEEKVEEKAPTTWLSRAISLWPAYTEEEITERAIREMVEREQEARPSREQKSQEPKPAEQAARKTYVRENGKWVVK
jgi:hypothetical protein